MVEFGSGAGDFSTVANLAWKVYNVYKDRSGDLKNLSDEIKSLHRIVDQQKDKPHVKNLHEDDQQRLAGILQGCTNVLKYLDQASPWLGAWGPEGVTTLRKRLVSNTTLLNIFITR